MSWFKLMTYDAFNSNLQFGSAEMLTSRARPGTLRLIGEMALGRKSNSAWLPGLSIVTLAFTVCCLVINSSKLSRDGSEVTELVSVQAPTGDFDSFDFLNLLSGVNRGNLT